MAQEEFIRVGTTLYKIVNQPRINGGFVKKRIVWNNETLRQDYGKDFIATVPKYDGFCTVPNHVNYQPVVDKFLNLYEPIGHRPKEGEFPHVESLIRHIFGEQYELGMDYLQLLYLQPVQKLPILLMVSEERNTGKSTFLNFLKAVFQMQLFAFDILGLQNERGANNDAREEAYGKVVDMVLDLRAKAKAEKNWAVSDQIRDALADAGFQVKDTKDGVTWKLDR